MLLRTTGPKALLRLAASATFLSPATLAGIQRAFSASLLPAFIAGIQTFFVELYVFEYLDCSNAASYS